MSKPEDLRASERIPIGNKVKVVSNGRIVAYVIAVNLSLGGVLLSAQPSLPVGSSCEVAILNAGGGGGGLVAKGTIVRSDDRGTAIQFASALARSSFEAVVHQGAMGAASSLVDSYRNYFRVSRSEDLAECEQLLGVTKKQFRTVFYSTFSTCIPLAVAPVWFLRASIPPYPNLVKILLAFAYGAIWLLVLQPMVDLTVFRVLKSRAQRRSAS